MISVMRRHDLTNQMDNDKDKYKNNDKDKEEEKIQRAPPKSDPRDL